MAKKRLAIRKSGRQQRFHSGASYIMVSPSGYGTRVRVVASDVEINGRRHLIVRVTR